MDKIMKSWAGTEADRVRLIDGIQKITEAFEFKPNTASLREQVASALRAKFQEEVERGDILPWEDKYEIVVEQDAHDPGVLNAKARRKIPAEIDAAHFEEQMGRPPENDDLERSNCKEGGGPGHMYCGWCPECDMPRFACEHVAGHSE